MTGFAVLLSYCLALRPLVQCDSDTGDDQTSDEKSGLPTVQSCRSKGGIGLTAISTGRFLCRSRHGRSGHGWLVGGVTTGAVHDHL